MRLVRQYDKSLDAFELPGEFLQQRHEHRIDKNVPVFGVVDDEGDLLGEQPRIDRMADITGAADAIINLQVPIVVPGERGHPVAPFQAEAVERGRKLFCPPDGIADRITVSGVVHRNRHDFAIGMKTRGVLGNRGNH